MVRKRLPSCRMVYFSLNMFSVKRVVLVMFLCLCITGSIPGGLTADSPTTRTFNSHKQKLDRKQAIDAEISPPANMDSGNQNELVNKPQLRHSRFHKLDYLFKKISKNDESNKKHQKENPDIPPENVLKESIKKSPTNDPVIDVETVQATEPTENPRRILTRSVPARFSLRVKHPEDFDEDKEDGYEEDYEEGEEEEYDEEKEEQAKLLHRDAELGSQKPSDLVNHYIIAEDKWTDTEADADFINDNPSQEDYEQDWEYGSQSDASDGPATETKWVHYGTRDELRPHARKHQRVKQEDIAAAIQHTLLMTREGGCRRPQKRVISVQAIHHNPSKQYIPHCTFLHRCGDDTGCCRVDTMTCAPKSTHKVELHFYTATVGHERHVIEKLSFINHTECECIPKREDFMVKDETSTLFGRPGNVNHNFDDFEMETPQPFKRCQCPAEYSVHILDDGECACDCSNKQRDCMRIKRGKEYFGLKDRLCIQNGQCQTPNCEFGEYIKKSGRCPRRQEKEEPSKHSRTFGK